MKPFKRHIIASAATAVLLLSACGNQTSESEIPAIPTIETVMSGGVIKSSQDKREYAYKQLDNGIKIIVVSDPEADKAAASLDVHIGHLADPADREGLTHYLEHMLFLGTEKYPEVGEYQKFISKNGGGNNAGTGQEHTSYYFQIDNGSLEPALDRFSRFFIDPLFDPEYVEKERNAVHSEYSLKVQEDSRRYREALKQTANQDHPATQFSVGNLSTLSDSDQSTIYDAVKAHYDKYYSADIMTLSVLGNYSTDQLMEWAEAKFSDVPSNGDNRNLDRPAPYTAEQLGVKIMINTLEDKRTLSLNFALPASDPHYDAKPLSYISNLIGHEGEGTLYDVLKSKNYLKTMYTSTWGPDEYTHFRTYFELTNEGYENVDEITDYFFSYIEKIKTEGVTQAAFVEKANLSNLNFEFQDKFSVSSYAGMITNNLHYYPPEHALDIGRVHERFDPEIIGTFLNAINPETVRMVMSTPDFDGQQREERYDVAYNVEPLAPETIAQWQKFSHMDAVSLPKPNPYIAEDLEARNQDAITKPELVVDNPALKLWYVNENEFELPKASLNLGVYSKHANDSPAHIVALALHARIVGDLLNSKSYPASQAGLYYDVSSFGRGYQVSVQGYNDKINVYQGTVIDSLDPDLVTPDVFERMKKNYEQDVANRAFARPINQVFNEFGVEINKQAIDNDDILRELGSLDLATFKSLIADNQSALEIKGLYSGNISKEDVTNAGDVLEAKFKERLTPDSHLPYNQITIPEGANDYVRQVSVDHADSTIVWAFQADNNSIQTRAKTRLLQQLIRSRFYKSLRTDQQYGYVVGMFNQERDTLPYSGFYIQSPKAHPSVLKAKIEEFLDGEVEYLTSISDEEFQSQMDGLLSNINKKYDNVYVKGDRLSAEIRNGNLDFDTRADLTEAIKNLTAADMLDYLNSEFLSDQRRSMVLWNVGTAHTETPEYDVSNFDLCADKHCVLTRF